MEDRGISTHHLIAVLLIVVLLNLVLFMVYRNHLNQELNQELKIQVSSEVSKYVALSQIKELNNDEGQNDTTLEMETNDK